MKNIVVALAFVAWGAYLARLRTWPMMIAGGVMVACGVLTWIWQ